MFQFLKKLFAGTPAIDFKNLVDEGAIIIDVRSGSEYQSGHISGARNIPLDEIKLRTKEIMQLKKPVITCCRSGARSSMAAKQLQLAGIECYNGGGWQTLKEKLQ